MLSAVNLTRRFGDRVAVADASFTLEPGEIFALLGPNGAGKTTTLRMLAGLIAPSSGTITLDGRPLTPETAPDARRHIGFLTESPGLWGRLTVSQNLAVYARLQGVRDVKGAVDAALSLFDLADRGHDLAAQLSKGLKQRVALARTLIHEPGVVLLDEPTSGLDPESARDVRELIRKLRATGRAVLLSSHNLDEVERVADRVAVLRTRMVALDTPSSLRTRLFGARVRIEVGRDPAAWVRAAEGTGVSEVAIDGRLLVVSIDDPRAHTPSLISRLVTAGADIISVVPDEPSLEEVYLRLLDDPAATEDR